MTSSLFDIQTCSKLRGSGRWSSCSKHERIDLHFHWESLSIHTIILYQASYYICRCIIHLQYVGKLCKIVVRSKCRPILWYLEYCRFLLAAPSTLLTHSMAVTTRTCLFRSPLGHEKRFIWIYEDIKAISLAAAFDGLFSNVCYQYLSIFVRFCQYVPWSLTVKLPLGNL